MEYPILQHFAYTHLPADLQEVSRPFCTLAHDMAELLPRCAETSAGLRKLLEAKDCAIRAAIEAKNARQSTGADKIRDRL